MKSIYPETGMNTQYNLLCISPELQTIGACIKCCICLCNRACRLASTADTSPVPYHPCQVTATHLKIGYSKMTATGTHSPNELLWNIRAITQNPTMHQTNIPQWMHHFVAEMCTHVHISVTKWCIVGHGTDALWDCGKWDWCIVRYVQQVGNDHQFVHKSSRQIHTRSVGTHRVQTHSSFLCDITF